MQTVAWCKNCSTEITGTPTGFLIVHYWNHLVLIHLHSVLDVNPCTVIGTLSKILKNNQFVIIRYTFLQQVVIFMRI